LGGLNTYDISFNMTQLFSAKIHAGERTEHSKMRYFFRKMLFFEIFWTFKFDQKFEPKSRNCGDSNDSQYKDEFQNSRISAKAVPAEGFCAFVSIEIERLRVVYQLTLEKNRGITRLKHY